MQSEAFISNWEKGGMRWGDLLVVSLLSSDEDDSTGADPQLQHDVAVRAQHGQDAAFLLLMTPKLHRQTELICKTKRKALLFYLFAF